MLILVTSNRQSFDPEFIKQLLFLFVDALVEESAQLLQWLVFFSPEHCSPCMYHFLVKTLIGLGGTQWSRVRVPASARNFFVQLRSWSEGTPVDFVRHCATFFSRNFLCPKGPP